MFRKKKGKHFKEKEKKLNYFKVFMVICIGLLIFCLFKYKEDLDKNEIKPIPTTLNSNTNTDLLEKIKTGKVNNLQGAPIPIEIKEKMAKELAEKKAKEEEERRLAEQKALEEKQKLEEEERKKQEQIKIAKKKEVTSRGSSTTRTENNQAVTGTKAEYQSYAKTICNNYGWSENDFQCLVKLWNKESGWNPAAKNKSSGAYRNSTSTSCK